MTALVRALVESGLVDSAMVRELQRWGVPVEPLEVKPPASAQELTARLLEAVEREGYTLFRETDLQVLERYLASQKIGLLFVADSPEGAPHPPISVAFGRTKECEYVLPWRSEGIKDLLTNGTTFLLDDDRKVYFRDVRELFFGETKAFLVCTVDAGRAEDSDADRG